MKGKVIVGIILVFLSISLLRSSLNVAACSGDFFLRTDKEVYERGENVTITFTNGGNATVELPSWPSFEIYGSQGYVAPTQRAFMIVKVPPGESHVWTWDQIGFINGLHNPYIVGLVPTGTYTVILLIRDPATGLWVGNLTMSFEITDIGPEFSEVDLAYLAAHMADFFGKGVKTEGIVKYYASIYMYEDFWLQAQDGGATPVVVRFAGLPTPPENSSIKILGIIEYCDLEGGFLYLNACWIDIVPEFPSGIILPLFMILSIIAVIFTKRRLPRKKRVKCGLYSE